VRAFTNRHAGALILIPLLTLVHVLGAASVPFHPDETSLLYQSRDLEVWLTHPWDLSWQPGGSADDPENYRALNAPLSKYILGIGRRLAGFGPQAASVDWDWTEDWGQNALAGALPDPRMLLGARLASSLLIGLTLVFIYLTGLAIGDRWIALLAVVLVGTNALVLLHARRAMAEGTLLLAVSLALWGITTADRRPWLAGIGSALAFAAKQSAAPLALAGLASSVWPRAPRRGLQWRRGLVFGAAALAVTAVIQPFFWSHPLGAAQAMFDARRSLLGGQIRAVTGLTSVPVLASPGDRLAAMVGELFIIPPQLAEAGNYLKQTAVQDAAYLANPFHRLFRGFIGGALMLLITLTGLVLSLWPQGEDAADKESARRWLAATGLLQAMALLWANPLPYQRYYLPLIPYVALWGAVGLVGIGRAISMLRGGYPARAA
jgi:4-amino-4-deoxy-L-arabinose transferase-like glycosyltransferase